MRQSPAGVLCGRLVLRKIRAYIVGRFARIVRRVLRRGGFAPRFKTGLLLRRSLFLLRLRRGYVGGLLPVLLKLGKVAVDFGNEFSGGGADGFKRRFQFGKLLAATPPGHIAKGVVGRIKAVILADGVGDTLRLHLAGVLVGAGLLLLLVAGMVVQPRMGYFMYRRL